jgi:hypothetical protein
VSAVRISPDLETRGVKPEDVLADAEDFVTLNGVTVRKGSIAAFLKNIDLLEDSDSSELQKAAALDALRALAPAMIASGLTKHATFRNKSVHDILDDKAGVA